MHRFLLQQLQFDWQLGNAGPDEMTGRSTQLAGSFPRVLRGAHEEDANRRPISDHVEAEVEGAQRSHT
jgi:hypothetical protein